MLNRKNNEVSYNGSSAPCDSCDRRPVCAHQKLACEALRSWASQGDLAWSDERIPTHANYLRMMGNLRVLPVRLIPEDDSAEISDAMASLRARCA